jgi:hypothetical protein
MSSLYCLTLLAVESSLDDNKESYRQLNKLSKELRTMFVEYLELHVCFSEVHASFLS